MDMTRIAFVMVALLICGSVYAAPLLNQLSTDGKSDVTVILQAMLDARAKKGRSSCCTQGNTGSMDDLRAFGGDAGRRLAGPHFSLTNQGTCLLAYGGQGQENGPPLITLHTNSTLKGVTIAIPSRGCLHQAVPMDHCRGGDAPERDRCDASQPLPGHRLQPAPRDALHPQCLRLPAPHRRPDRRLHGYRPDRERPLQPQLLDARPMCRTPPKVRTRRLDGIPEAELRCLRDRAERLGVHGQYLQLRVQGRLSLLPQRAGVANGNFLGIAADWAMTPLLVEDSQPPGL